MYNELFEWVLREAGEADEDKPIDPDFKRAIDEYEKNQPFADGTYQIDIPGKNFDTGPTQPPAPIKKTFEDYLNDAKRRQNG